MNQSLLKVAIKRLKVRSQARKAFDVVSIAGLAGNIQEVGLQQPLNVIREADDYLVIDGERRLRACQSLGMDEVPVLVVEDALTIADILVTQLACNLQREDLTALDRAEAIRCLMEKGSLSADEVAKRLGLSAATVSKTLSVLKLPEPIRDQVASGDIPADAGYMLARVEEPAKQAALAAEVVAGKLSRDALARKLKRVRRAEEQSTKGPNRVTALLGSGRSVTVAAKGLNFDVLIEVLDHLLSRARKSKSQGISLTTFLHTLRDQAA